LVQKESENELYSWGMGENYVLGNRDDQNEFKPYKVNPKMFKEKKVIQISSGINHVVALALDEGVTEAPAMDFTKF
jgi:alpha-tubulin suppressor-like RCC1 family protein